ncbi:MAG: OmpA family protein [Crocinitomicaceae bacterium]
MKKILLILFLFSSLVTFTQDIQGKWIGTITQNPNRSFYFEIEINTATDKDGSVSGTTFIREEKSGNYGTIKFSGTFKNNVLSFQESEIIKEDRSKKDGYWGTNTFYWCIKKGELSFEQSEDKMVLKGPWTGAEGCPPGNISVSKKVTQNESKEITDCWGDPPSADFLYGIWTGNFKQYSCGVYGNSSMIILIDKVEGLTFSGVFIWTGMQYAEDSRSTLEGEIRDGKIYFYEREILTGSGLVLNGTYTSTLPECDKMKGIWTLDAPTTECPEKTVTESGGDYLLTHYKIPTVYFDTDQSDLRKKSIKDLYQFSDFLKKFPSLKIEISAHTDNSGSNARNLILSEERAKVVEQLLISRGIKKSRITITYHAHINPCASNSTPEGRQLNRRAELKIIAK